MKVETYKGHPILVLGGDQNEREVRLGLTKCKAVLANTDTIKLFVAQYDQPNKTMPATVPAEAAAQLAALQQQVATLAKALTVTSPAHPNGRFNPAPR